MANHDEFYRVYNIYGYSGNLHEKPSVYFLTDTHFGRITQKYDDDPTNVGRMAPMERQLGTYEYHIINTMMLGPPCCYEYWEDTATGNQQEIHRSRNLITVVRDWGPERLTPTVLALLAESITNFPRLKERERPGFRG